MISDKDKWNARYEKKHSISPSTPEFIIDSVPFMQAGSVLDVASGDGASALYLAEKGFEVTAIDVSDIALQRLQGFANDANSLIKTKVVDLDDHDALTELPKFDNITVTFYKPSAEQWLSIVSCLKTDGVLLMSTFNMKHHEKTHFPKRFCLQAGELKSLGSRLNPALHTTVRLTHYASVVRGNSHMDDYRFIKQAL